MDAYSLRVCGKVQRVGFRRFVLDSAQELGLSGHAKHLSDGSIEVFVQGEKDQLSKFLELVRKPSPPAAVRTVKEQEVAVNPEIGGFKLIYGELVEELQEGFGAMQAIFMDYRKEFGDFAGRTHESFKSMADKYGEISAKLTVILETLIRESRETKEMLNESLKALREAIDRLPKAA